MATGTCGEAHIWSLGNVALAGGLEKMAVF